MMDYQLVYGTEYTLPSGEKLIFNTAGTEVDPADMIEYDENGWSVETSFGCVQNKFINEYLAELEAGDEYDKAAAAKLPRWHCVELPDREYDEDTHRIMRANFHREFSWSPLLLARFYPAPVKTANGGTDWGVAEPDHAVPIYGFEPTIIYKSYPKNFKMHFQRGIDVARYRGENPNAPSFANYRERQSG